jgi:hypothetical protein
MHAVQVKRADHRRIGHHRIELVKCLQSKGEIVRTSLDYSMPLDIRDSYEGHVIQVRHFVLLKAVTSSHWRFREVGAPQTSFRMERGGI